MKVAILAGGMGTRLSGETESKPKPLVQIGDRPILWHIMELYSRFGFEDFVIALGYKGDAIKQYFAEACTLRGDLHVDFKTGDVVAPQDAGANWRVDLVDTGLQTQTGGRIKRLRPLLGDSRFFLTWGDGLANINIPKLLEFHRSHGKLATLTATRPPARFGHLELDGPRVTDFAEKPQAMEGWINGAFFVLEPGVFDYIEGDATQFEREPLQRLAADGQLMAYRHESFWQCMDTPHEKRLLESYWESGEPPWLVLD